jgi:hypothetical protein
MNIFQKNPVQVLVTDGELKGDMDCGAYRVAIDHKFVLSKFIGPHAVPASSLRFTCAGV